MPSLTAAPIAITGASGYIASHVVRELLDRGATVHATVRDPDRADAVAHLTRLGAARPGSLKLFKADLLQPGSYAEALDGCEIVLHTASPFIVGAVTDPVATFIQPALDGTRNVLAACDATPSVRRVVLTSSVFAVCADPTETQARGRPTHEGDWNEVSRQDYDPYAYSKLVAEREGWAIAARQDRWRLVTVLPTFVMGPSLTSRVDSASIDFLLGLCNGRQRAGIWDQSFGWVDVRDVALAHVEAAARDDAEGRHLLLGEVRWIWEVLGWLQEDFGPKVKLPRFKVPKWAAYLAGPPNGYDWEFVRRQVAVEMLLDGSRSRERLGVAYRPLRETVRDHVAQLLRDGLLKV